MCELVRIRLRAAAFLAASLGAALPLQAAVEGVDYNQPPLEFVPQTFLFSLVLFVLFILFMRRFAWGPLIRELNAREARIVRAEHQAEAAHHEAERLRNESERRLTEVQDEVKSIVAKARAEGEARKLEIVAQAEQEAQRIKAEALAALGRAREEALEELNRTVDEQAMTAVEHIAGRRV